MKVCFFTVFKQLILQPIYILFCLALQINNMLIKPLHCTRVIVLPFFDCRATIFLISSFWYKMIVFKIIFLENIKITPVLILMNKVVRFVLSET